MTKQKVLVILVLALILVGLGVYKYVYAPAQERAEIEAARAATMPVVAAQFKEFRTGMRDLSSSVSGWSQNVTVKRSLKDDATIIIDVVTVVHAEEAVARPNLQEPIYHIANVVGRSSANVLLPLPFDTGAEYIAMCHVRGSMRGSSCYQAPPGSIEFKTRYPSSLHTVEPTNFGVRITVPSHGMQRDLLRALDAQVIILAQSGLNCTFPDMPTPDILAAMKAPERMVFLDPIIACAGLTYGVHPALIKAFIMKESGGNPLAESIHNFNYITPDKNSQGVMQLSPPIQKQYGLQKDEWKDPVKNIDAGVRHMLDLQKKYRTIRLMAAVYNGGPDAVAPSTACPGQIAFECKPVGYDSWGPRPTWTAAEHQVRDGLWYVQTRPYVEDMERAFLLYQPDFSKVQVAPATK